jgi:hypothetical protein
LYNYQVGNPDDRDVLITDDNYSAIWDTRDLNLIKKKFALIRYNFDRGDHAKVKEIWEDGIERKMNRMDEGSYVVDTPDDPKPLEVNKKRDLLTNDGMALLASIIIGNVLTRPSHYAAGNGTVIPTVGDTSLQSERARIGLATDGFAIAAGTTCRWGAIFIPTFPSFVIAESGVVNAAQAGRFLNRTVYPTPRLTHSHLLDFFTLAITVSLTAV